MGRKISDLLDCKNCVEVGWKSRSCERSEIRKSTMKGIGQI